MAASSALLIVCRSGCDLMSMCVMEFVLRFTTPAPNIGFSLTKEVSWVPSSVVRFGLEYCCVWTWEGWCRGVDVGFATVYVCCIQSGSDDHVCLGYMSVFVG